MADEIEKELDGVTNDTPETDTEIHEPTDAELQEKLQAAQGVKTEGTATETKTTEEKTETKTEQPKTEPPAVDLEAEVTKRRTEWETEQTNKWAQREAELEKKHQEERQKAIDAVIAKERKREESAMRKLRDLQAATGMDVDRLLESHRAQTIAHLQTEQGLSEEAARNLVLAQEKAALYEAREAERQREHEENTKTAHYREQKLDFAADTKQPDIFKKALQKFGAEVDTFSDFGRAVDFDVALKYVAGQHLPEIMAEVAKEAETEKAKLKADAEAAVKATEQKFIRNHQASKQAAPETSTAGVPQTETLTADQRAMAKVFGVDPAAVAKNMAQIQKIRGKR